MKKPMNAVFCLLAFAVPGSATAQAPSAPLPRILQAQPVSQSPTAIKAATLIGWRSGAITCNGVLEMPLYLPIPDDRIGWRGVEASLPKLVTIYFAIDATGRPHAIKRSAAKYSIFAHDLEPALATARFKPGSTRTACNITYEPDVVDIASAPVDRLLAYSIFPSSQRLPKIGYDRVRSILTPGSTCVDPPPVVRNRAFPDFQAIQQPPAKRDVSMISYDINRQGRTINVRVAQSTGNVALDRASMRAVAQSRYAAGARRGCLYPYWRRGSPLAAPAISEELAPSPDSGCPVSEQWKTQPVLRFPEPYMRRGVEGWGIVAYDVAPWGATGNLRVIASEPSADFGIAAMNTVRAATKEASTRGYTNCQTRVRFVIARPSQPTADGAARGAVEEPVAPF